MKAKELIQLQTSRGATTGMAYSSEKSSLERVESECRKYLEDRADKYRDLGPREKMNSIKQNIIQFVMNEKPVVEGYILDDNSSDTARLIDKLIENITDRGFLREALNDDRVNEIRINGKEVKVEVEGRIVDLTDRDGNILEFKSQAEQDIILKRLLGDERISKANQLVNTSTLEGYRVAAVHWSATGIDPRNPLGERYSVAVIRKFSEEKMLLDDIVKHKTMSDQMALLLSMWAVGGLTMVTVGPTSSGKSTTNNSYIRSIPDDIRTVLIQNPSEVDGRKKDETGRIVNDIIHLEGRDSDDPNDKKIATPENLIDMSLRLSPTMFGFGEFRTNNEFAQGEKLLLAGHPINATYHAVSILAAVRRWANAVTSATGEPVEISMQTISENLNLVTVQKFMKDGSRKVIEMGEVLGMDPENPTLPKINVLFKFIPSDPVLDDNNRVIEIPGVHKRVGVLSEFARDKMRMEGIPSNKIERFLKPVANNEVGTYTGKGISVYDKE